MPLPEGPAMKTVLPCKLCGLPVKTQADPAKDVFCCNGCKMVHAMLMESQQCKDATDFKDTALYKQCVAAGVIPDTSRQEPAPEAPSGPFDSDTLLTFHFQVKNMWCPACAWVLENALTRSNGVTTASCNFSSDRGTVRYDPVKTSPDKIFTIIEKLGYKPAFLDQRSRTDTREFVRLFATLFLTMNVMMLSWAVYSGFFTDLSARSVQLLAWPAALMASVVVFWGGYPIHRRTLSGIRSGWTGMETLISTGSLSTYGYSLFQLSRGSLHLYFDASSMLILLILTGKMLEQNAKNRISQGLGAFFSLVPQKVRICTDAFPNGRYVSIKQLSKGDLFMAEEGEILAADGVVTQGEALIDESSVTGEAKPVRAGLDDKVKSGTRIISGKIQVKAKEVGEDSILGRMLKIMENSLSSKTARTRRFETLLKYFVPTVMGLSVATCFFWMLFGLPPHEAFNRGISVLVISCPCALGIAIPLALTAGVSAAGKRGILVRDFEAFERVEGLDTLVFDKTGTLTTGRLEVLGMETENGFPEKKAWQMILAMEQASDHYIAHTIRAYGMAKGIEPLELENLTHHPNGISCRFQNETYRFGSMDFVQKENSAAPSSPAEQGAQIISTVFLSTDDKILAAVRLGDSMKAGVTSLVADLHNMGFTSFLVSGDAEKTTLAAGAFVNIPAQRTRGGLLPHEKAGFIQELKQSGKKTAMVGDGVNDAPAMARSDLAVAVHSGLNPSEGVAAITLMQETPVQLLEFLSLAKRVNQKVRQNLWFALAYNVITIPVAAAGLLNPIIAATAMLLSSLSVTFNTLLLVKRESRNKISD